jgi:hypothetical protein
MREAAVVANQLDSLSGDEQRQHHARLWQLLITANRQQEEAVAQDQEMFGWGDGYDHTLAAAGGRTTQQASSPAQPQGSHESRSVQSIHRNPLLAQRAQAAMRSHSAPRQPALHQPDAQQLDPAPCQPVGPPAPPAAGHVQSARSSVSARFGPRSLEPGDARSRLDDLEEA